MYRKKTGRSWWMGKDAVASRRPACGKQEETHRPTYFPIGQLRIHSLYLHV